MATREPIRESGWYRLTAHGWERVPDEDAEMEEMTGGGWDLVHVQINQVEVPLW
jgi:hypothetical protein